MSSFPMQFGIEKHFDGRDGDYCEQECVADIPALFQRHRWEH
ncbi:MAG: hypothetical protein ACOH2M_32810 [Cypionkella sp.]